jgi:hypothetical protein
MKDSSASTSEAVSRFGNPINSAAVFASFAIAVGMCHGQCIGQINRAGQVNPRIALPSATPAPVAPAELT